MNPRVIVSGFAFLVCGSESTFAQNPPHTPTQAASSARATPAPAAAAPTATVPTTAHPSAAGGAPNSMQTPQINSPKTPTVASPTVTAPAGASAPSASTPAFNTSPQKAALIATAYDESAFKNANASGNAVLLLFSGAADAVWQHQSTVLQAILREAEFAKIPVFQIDATNADLMSKYSVQVPGTLLLVKAGVERLRSTRMVKADVIRKMLRLQSAL